MNRNFGNFVENCIFARTMFERIRYNETEREKKRTRERRKVGEERERETLYTHGKTCSRPSAREYARARARAFYRIDKILILRKELPRAL